MDPADQEFGVLCVLDVGDTVDVLMEEAKLRGLNPFRFCSAITSTLINRAAWEVQEISDPSKIAKAKELFMKMTDIAWDDVLKNNPLPRKKR